MIQVDVIAAAALLVVLLVQTAGIFYWAGSVRALLDDHGKRIRDLEKIHPRFGRRHDDGRTTEGGGK